MKYINLTPHEIVLNDGTTFPPSGKVARVTTEFETPKTNIGVGKVRFGKVENVPDSEFDTIHIVSGIVESAMGYRLDVVAPATGHPDVVRNEKGHIVSVPFFVKSK